MALLRPFQIWLEAKRDFGFGVPMTKTRTRTRTRTRTTMTNLRMKTRMTRSNSAVVVRADLRRSHCRTCSHVE